MRFLLLMIMSVNLVFAKGVCVADKQNSAFGEVTELISATNNISSELGEFIDPGPPDEFQVFDFCQQLRDDGVVFGSEAEKIFIKYMSEKLLGINSGYQGKTINDQPYSGYIKKYLHKLQCDTRDITSLSMREKNSFFKHMIDIGRADYIAEYYLTRCSSHLDNSDKLDANQFEVINGEKETILDFVIKSIDFRNNRSINITQNQDQLIRIKESLIRYCGAKRGADL